MKRGRNGVVERKEFGAKNKEAWERHKASPSIFLVYLEHCVPMVIVSVKYAESSRGSHKLSACSFDLQIAPAVLLIQRQRDFMQLLCLLISLKVALSLLRP